MAELDLVVKLKADMRDLMKQIKNLPKETKKAIKVQLDTGGESVGKELAKQQKNLLGGLKKVGLVVGVAAASMALYAKASPRFANAVERLIKTILIFFRPLGDLFGKFINQISKWIRDMQKGRKKAIEKLGPGKTAAAEFGGAAVGTVGGALAGAGAAAGVGALVGTGGGPVGMAAGAIGGAAIGAGLGFFFGPQALVMIEDFLSGAQAAMGQFASYAQTVLAPILMPHMLAIGAIATKWQEISPVVAQIWNDITSTIGSALSSAWNFFSTEFIQPVMEGWNDLSSAIMETATAWARYIYDNFIDPVIQDFKDWYAEITETIIKPIVEWMKKNVITPLEDAWNNLAGTITTIWEGIKKTIEDVYNAVKPMIEFIKGGLSAAGQAIGGALSGAAAAVRSARPPGYQVGTAFVPETGLYRLHRGETVVPSTRGGGGGVTINAPITMANTINREMDLDRLAEEVSKRLYDRFRMHEGG